MWRIFVEQRSYWVQELNIQYRRMERDRGWAGLKKQQKTPQIFVNVTLSVARAQFKQRRWLKFGSWKLNHQCWGLCGSDGPECYVCRSQSNPLIFRRPYRWWSVTNGQISHVIPWVTSFLRNPLCWNAPVSACRCDLVVGGWWWGNAILKPLSKPCDWCKAILKMGQCPRGWITVTHMTFHSAQATG